MLGGETVNAADLQIATTSRLMLTIGDVRPYFAGRPAEAHAMGLFGEWAGSTPAGRVPGGVALRRAHSRAERRVAGSGRLLRARPRARSSRMRPASASGASSLTKVRAPAIGARRAPSAAARRSPSSRAKKRSSWPQATSDGISSDGRRAAASSIVALSIARMKATASRRMSASSRNGRIQAAVTSSGISCASQP